MKLNNEIKTKKSHHEVRPLDHYDRNSNIFPEEKSATPGAKSDDEMKSMVLFDNKNCQCEKNTSMYTY